MLCLDYNFKNAVEAKNTQYNNISGQTDISGLFTINNLIKWYLKLSFSFLFYDSNLYVLSFHISTLFKQIGYKTPQKETDKKILFFFPFQQMKMLICFVQEGIKICSIVNWFSFRRDGVVLNYINFSGHCGKTVYNGLNLNRDHHMDTLAYYCLVCHMDRYNQNV